MKYTIATRAFDGPPDVPTYLFVRGEESKPDRTRAIEPGVARDATAALARTAERLVDTVKAAARAHVVARAAPAEAQPTSAAQHRAVPLSRIGLVRGSTALIAIGASVVGLYASYYAAVASGAAIVLACTAFFGVAWLVRTLRR
jgi:hypothetical protein